MKAFLFLLTLLVLLFSIFSKAATKSGAPFQLLLRLAQLAGIAANTTPGRR